MDQSPGNILDRLIHSVRNEPRKAGTLAVLLVLMGLAWAKATTRGVASPSTVYADDRLAVESDAAPRATVAPTMAALLEWNSGPIPLTRRNLFAAHPDLFPVIEPDAQSAPLPETGDGFWDQLAKSMAARADQEKARRAAAEAIVKEAQQLELHSTVMSNGSHKALVNGILLSEGETVHRFRIVKIEARRIVVEREGVRVEVFFKQNP